MREKVTVFESLDVPWYPIIPKIVNDYYYLVFKFKTDNCLSLSTAKLINNNQQLITIIINEV